MFVGVIWGFTSAINFSINFNSSTTVRAGYMRRNIAPIHFKENWNDFGWFVYFSNGVGTGDDYDINEAPYIVVLTGENKKIYECRQRVKWFYYNAERGERLRSLDDTYDMGWVEVRGWFYTRCNRAWFRDKIKKCWDEKNEALREECEKNAREAFADTHWYYWMIWHEYHGHTFLLSAWTNYVPYEVNSKQRIMWNELTGTLIRFDNKYPVWFIYDANGGLWFLWGKITDDNMWVEDIYDAYEDPDRGNNDLENLFKFNDEGNGISSILEWVDTSGWWSATNSLLSVIVDWLVWINRDTKNTGIQKNQSNDKMQYFSSVNINNMQLINYAKQRAEILCRGKWKSSFDSSSTLQCLDGVWGGVYAKTGVTYIVKNSDVRVTDMNDFVNGWNYDIFVDNWNLIIEEVTDDKLKVFKKNGFISDMEYDVFSGVKNTLIEFDSEYTWDEVVAWKFIKWNFIVDGSIKATTNSGFDHVYFVYWKLTTTDTVDQLWGVFKRRCKMWIEGTDGVPCPGTEEYESYTWINPYENASLVIIDQNYPSPLYQ
jgi:hypothetical protein